MREAGSEPKPSAKVIPIPKPMTRPMPGEVLGKVLIFTGVTRLRPGELVPAHAQ